MIRSTIILACSLVLTACQSGGSRDATQSGSATTSADSMESTEASTMQSPSASPSQVDTSSSAEGIGETPSSEPIDQSASAERVPALADDDQNTDPATGSSATASPDENVQTPDPVAQTEQAASAATAGTSAGPDSSATSATSPEPVDTAPAKQSGTAPQVGMAASDQTITQSATNALTTAGISSQTLTNIQVRTMNGRVILTGQVQNSAERQQIEQQVRQIPGVRSVISQLRVAEPSALGIGAGASSGTGEGNSGAPNPSAEPQ